VWLCQKSLSFRCSSIYLTDSTQVAGHREALTLSAVDKYAGPNDTVEGQRLFMFYNRSVVAAAD